MTEQRERELIRRAINQRFSDRQENPWLAERIIKTERGEIKMKKKLSAGLVLTLILLFAALTALAAVTLDSFYSKLVEMYDNYGDSSHWTFEQAAEASDLAQEHDLTWIDGQVHVIPGPDEMQEEEVISKATEYAFTEYGLSAEEINSTVISHYYLEDNQNETRWRVRFYVKVPGRDIAITINGQGELIDTWVSNTENRLGAPESIGSETLKAVVSSKPVIIATEFLSGIIDVTWFDFDFNWYPNLSLTTVDGFGDDEVWVVTYLSPTMDGEFRVVVSQDEKILAWSLPGYEYTNLLPDDIEALLSEAQTFQPTQNDKKEYVTRLAKAVLQDRMDLSYEQMDSYRQEAYLIQHSKFAHGKEPVWLVLHYDHQNELVFKTLYTNGGILIAFAPPEMEFTDSAQ